MGKTRQPNWFDKANTAIRQTEGSLVNVLSALAPWGAPLIPATMVYYNLKGHLGFESWIALVSAGVAEILGLATVSTATVFWQSNRKERAGYKKMPVYVPVACFAWYLLVVITVNVLLEAPWSPQDLIMVKLVARSLLSTLTIPAAVTISIRAVHEAAIHGVAFIQNEQAEAQPELPSKQPELPLGNRGKILTELKGTPHITDTQIGMKLGISRQAVAKHRMALIRDGKIAGNGRGKEG